MKSMELDQIKQICNDNVSCHKCPLYDIDYFECVLNSNPNHWDLEEIKRRLEENGK